jgi:hypothetical protein
MGSGIGGISGGNDLKSARRERSFLSNMRSVWAGKWLGRGCRFELLLNAQSQHDDPSKALVIGNI